ncbi:MAG: hypothetical protein U0359_21730 [Byssovorax sp.]
MDFDNQDAEIPAYVEESTASATASCISVRAIVDVDGEATISLTTTQEVTDTHHFREVFRGSIATPNKRVAVVTSENEKLLEIEVSWVRSTIAVWVDDEAHPSRIVAQIIPRTT